MNERITVAGIVGTVPRISVTTGGIPLTSFRLAAHQSHFDRAKNAWIDDDSSWYSVTAFRQLATNAAESIQKGEHILVSGRLVIREWTNAERSGVDVEIIAEAIGHDLTWYTTTPVRSGIRSPSAPRPTTAQTGPDPTESAGSYQAQTHSVPSESVVRSGQSYVPDDTGAGSDVYARLDS